MPDLRVNTKSEGIYLQIGTLQVELVRKDIANLHLAVYPPDGRVSIAVPTHTGEQAVRQYLISRLGWIRRQQKAFAGQARISGREGVHNETYYYLGRRYRLKINQAPGKASVKLKSGHLVLTTTSLVSSERALKYTNGWYRERLRHLAAPILAHWGEKTGVQSSSLGIKLMRTTWGSCSIDSGRFWLNLKLAKRPHRCLEYLIIHELCHLLDRRHNARFRALLSSFMPDWEGRRKTLNEGAVESK